MKCYHITEPDGHVWKIEHHAMLLPSGKNMVVHMADRFGDNCPDEATCIGHLLDDSPVSASVATELQSFGVVATDTPRAVVLKMMKHHAHFRP